MKKMLAIAVAAALTAPAAVMADTTLYGKLATSVGSVEKNGGDSEVAIENHASRVGVKGSTPLDNGLQATYTLEFGVTPDGDGADAISRRNQWVGLKGGFGEVRAGTHDTPNKLSSAAIDNFPDTYADSSLIVTDRRAPNALAYINKFGPVTAAVAHVTEVGDDADGVDGASANSLLLGYGSTKEGVYAALGYEDVEDAQTITKVSGQYAFPAGHKVNVVYEQQDNEDAGGANQTTAIVGGGVKMGNAMLKAQVAQTDIDDTDEDIDYQTVGVDYKLGKKTDVYFLYHNKDVDNATDVGDMQATAVGIRHVF